MKISNKNSTLDVSARGEVVSFTLCGREYMWNGHPSQWGWSSPTLFPFAGKVKGGVCRFDGVEYPQTYPQHGFLRYQMHEFAVDGDNSVVATVKYNEQTLKLYPFKFAVTVRYTLIENGYRASFTVKNLGDGDMPFCLGSHPSYMMPSVAQNCDIILKTPENAVYYTADEGGFFNPSVTFGVMDGNKKAVADELFACGGMIFDGICKDNAISVIDRSTGKGWRVDFYDFPCGVLWLPVGKQCPFLCVEPWQGLPDYSDFAGEFKDKPYAITLGSGEEKTLYYDFTVI